MSAGNTNKAHLFGDAKQADSYKKYRPTYAEVFPAIYDYAGSAPTGTALDVATGKPAE